MDVNPQRQGQTCHAVPVADVTWPDQLDGFGMATSGIGQGALDRPAER